MDNTLIICKASPICDIGKDCKYHISNNSFDKHKFMVLKSYHMTCKPYLYNVVKRTLKEMEMGYGKNEKQ